MAKKLYSSPSKLAGLVGIKTADMKTFIEGLGKNVKVKNRHFTGQDGQRVDYIEVETVKAIAYYETYFAKVSEIKEVLLDSAIEETVVPDVGPVTTEKVEDTSNIPQYTPDGEEIPF